MRPPPRPGVVAPGEKLLVVSRPLFAQDARRHFIGEVIAVADGLARLQGFVFVYEPARGQFIRRADPRTRIVGLGDALLVIKVLPHDVPLEALSHVLGADGSLELTDGRGFAMDIHEFLPQ